MEEDPSLRSGIDYTKIAAELAGFDPVRFKEIYYNVSIFVLIKLYSFYAKEKWETEHRATKRMLIQMDILGKMLFGDKYTKSLAESFEHTPSASGVHPSQEGNKQETMLGKLASLGIPIKETDEKTKSK